MRLSWAAYDPGELELPPGTRRSGRSKAMTMTWWSLASEGTLPGGGLIRMPSPVLIDRLNGTSGCQRRRAGFGCCVATNVIDPGCGDELPCPRSPAILTKTARPGNASRFRRARAAVVRQVDRLPGRVVQRRTDRPRVVPQRETPADVEARHTRGRHFGGARMNGWH